MSDGEKKTIFKIIILTAFWISGDFKSVEAVSLRRAIKTGNEFYQKGDYAASREKYQQALEKNSESDIVNFNLGTTLYKEEDYERAAVHLQKVLLSEEEGLREKAYYNLGNALYKAGTTVEDKDTTAAVSSLEKALTQYERALSIDQKDADAKHNYTFVQKELERLKEKQKQRRQQNQQKQDRKDQPPQNQKDQPPQGQKDQQQNQKEDQRQGQQDQPSETPKGQSNQPQGQPPGDQQEKQDQGHGQSSGEDYNNRRSSEFGPKDVQSISKEEAQRILENYKEGEEPRGLLNSYPKTQEVNPVLKDW